MTHGGQESSYYIRKIINENLFFKKKSFNLASIEVYIQQLSCTEYYESLCLFKRYFHPILLLKF